MSRIVLTGAGGSLAADVIPALLEAGHEVVAVDLAPPNARPGLVPFRADVTDLAEMRAAIAGADALVHLAGIPLEDDPDRLWDVNVRGTQVALEAARLIGVRRAVLASSIHAVGFVPAPDVATGLDLTHVPEEDRVPDDVAVRPNTFYGASKAAVEALGSMYADRWRLEVVLLRIASRQAEPTGRRHLRTWLSPADAGRLVLASVAAQVVGCTTVFGVSANSGRYVSSTGAARIGFTPQDDAEEYRDRVLETPVEHDQSAGWLHLLGGEFCSPEPPRASGSTTYPEAQ
ncbi:NAD-dependent epimerase/dehydratase family protein [Georgenia sp. Z1491]|uniref:NAD-dependent epimerase/dehydratase family protein n=1 Tax=Georgenia sp. Z1491 TaxID=3416707 RepID=UPI003CF5BDD2